MEIERLPAPSKWFAKIQPSFFVLAKLDERELSRVEKF
jgi:hypothetical protein